MKKIYILGILLIFVVFLYPLSLKAEQTIAKSEIFEARVVEIIQVQEKIRENGVKFEQQNLKLVGLEGYWLNKELIYNGISEIDVANVNSYKIGDKVLVDGQVNELGEENFYITDFVRSKYLYALFVIFIIIVLLVGRAKGFKALIGLFLSFVVIIRFILPQILKGADPFLLSLAGGLIILGIMIYLTEGFKLKSHIAILSVLISLSFTLLLSIIFTTLTKLSGLAQEEAAFLIGIDNVDINFKGLLLAGFIIGSIGVLDDIIVGQIEAVEQIKLANPTLSAKKVFTMAYKVGNTHIGAIINTLFLAYAGAALPLLLLFILNQDSGITFSRLINTEIVSTEIVRALVGSIGVVLSMPIATWLAAIQLKPKND
ncbi:YibE/F family protein [Patescibacteria group bacterium]|nr:YibE/F family protein [Patescibacteria group bacterium]